VGYANNIADTKSRIESVMLQNRPSPFNKGKYKSTKSNVSTYSPYLLGGPSLPQIKSSVMSPFPKASKTARTFFNKRSGSRGGRKLAKKKHF
jgi:hypothetical protein